MKRVRSAILGGAIAALLVGQAHAAKQTPCVTPAEVESVALVLLPDILRGLAKSCAPHLPAHAFLGHGDAAMLARYDSEVAHAWPGARDALLKISGTDDKAAVQVLSDASVARPLLTAFVVPGLTESIKPEECGTVSHMIELFEPLPARNVAGIFAAILQLAEADKGEKQGKNDLPICPLPKMAG